MAVSPLALRRRLSRPRRRVVVLVAMLAGAVAVAAHHSMPADMPDMPAGVACIAVLGAGVAIVTAIGLLALPRPRATPDAWRPAWAWIGAPQSAPVRAGPLFLRLQVLRR